MATKTQYNVDRLLQDGLIRKIPPSREKAAESIKTAHSWIKEAETNLGSNAIRSCIMSSYLAMFHAARGILFADGFREKSHFAVARYLEDRYVSKGLLEAKWVALLDHFRETRHDDQYSTTFFATREDAGSALDSVRTFVKRVEELAAKIV